MNTLFQGQHRTRPLFASLVFASLALVASMLGPGCATKDARSSTTQSSSEAPAIYTVTFDAPVEQTLTAMKSSLAQEGFGLLLEADIGKNLAKFADKWGPEYNRSGLEAIHSLVFCNSVYANQAANSDPAALALCPLRLTILHKGGESTILFVRPSVAAAETGASRTARVVEEKVMAAIDRVAANQKTASAGECTYDTDCRSGSVCEEHHCVRWWKLRGDTPQLSPADVHALATEGKIQLLDVRTAGEYRRGHIEGAVSVPLGKLEDVAFELSLDRDIPVVAVCLTAHRSVAATRLLERRGFDIVQLQGGMRAWRAAELPETKGATQQSPEGL